MQRRLACYIFATLLLLTNSDYTSADNTVPAAATGEKTLNFLLLGDWGKGGNSGGYATSHLSDSNNNDFDDDEEGPISKPGSNHSVARRNLKSKATYQAAVASAMGSYSQNFLPSFVVALGDNFYTNGVSSSTDVYWDYLWTNVYLDYYKELRIPWYPVFGNHDYGYGAKGIQAQLDRTLIDDYWSFISTNYSRTYDIPSGGTVAIVFVDTTTLAPSVNKCCNENGGISTAVQAVRIKNQLMNIDAMLEEVNENKPSWLLVAGHYPIFSKGEHGDTSELQSYLLPLLRKHNVDAYFCGHDHFSEHLVSGGTHFFVAGGGSMADYVGATSSATELWAGEGYSAFSSASASEKELKISYIDTDNVVQYTYTIVSSRATDRKEVTHPPSKNTPVRAAQTIDVSQKAVFISGGLAALAFFLIAGAFVYEVKGRRRRRRNKRGSSLLISCMTSPPPRRAMSSAGNDSRHSPASRWERSESMSMTGSPSSPRSLPQIKFYDLGPKRGLISLPATLNLIPDDEINTARMMRPLSLAHQRSEYPQEDSQQTSEEGLVVAATEYFEPTIEIRSIGGKTFKSVPSSPTPSSPSENHKRARTSLY